MCRASKQDKEIGDAATKTEVNAVKKCGYHARGPTGPKPPPKAKGAKKTAAGKQQCRFSGFSHVMTLGSCPAFGKKRNKCQGLNHLLQMFKEMVHQVPSDHPGDEFEEVGLIGTINNVTGTSRHQHRARIRVQGRDQAFLIDSGASTNPNSTHDVDITKLKMEIPGNLLKMWNGSKGRALGRGNH